MLTRKCAGSQLKDKFNGLAKKHLGTGFSKVNSKESCEKIQSILKRMAVKNIPWGCKTLASLKTKIMHSICSPGDPASHLAEIK